MEKIIRTLTWAWVIIIGGLMITPGGFECIACGGAMGTMVAGIISIALGIAGYVISKQLFNIQQTAAR
jgi:outer membrane lipoprotein SlyB